MTHDTHGVRVIGMTAVIRILEIFVITKVTHQLKRSSEFDA